MKPYTLTLVLLLLSCGSNGAYNEPEPVIDTSFPVSVSNSVYYGDSITWLCFRHIEIAGINRSVIGDRAYELLPLVEHYAPLDEDTEYFIMIGVADMWMPGSGAGYIESMTGIFTALEGERVNVFSILPTDGIWVDNDKIMGVNDKLRSLTYDHGFNYLDVYWDFVVSGGLDSKLTDDGLHLNADGCEKLFNTMEG